MSEHTKAAIVTNPDCLDGGPGWCCVDSDGTGLWCNSCLDVVHHNDCGVAGGWPHPFRSCIGLDSGSDRP